MLASHNKSSRLYSTTALTLRTFELLTSNNLRRADMKIRSLAGGVSILAYVAVWVPGYAFYELIFVVRATIVGNLIAGATDPNPQGFQHTKSQLMLSH